MKMMLISLYIEVFVKHTAKPSQGFYLHSNPQNGIESEKLNRKLKSMESIINENQRPHSPTQVNTISNIPHFKIDSWECSTLLWQEIMTSHCISGVLVRQGHATKNTQNPNGLQQQIFVTQEVYADITDVSWVYSG